MRFGSRKRMDTYTLVVGDPWRVNDHEIEATNSQDALQVIYEDAKKLPVYVDVTTAAGQTFHLIMEEDGSTRPADSPAENESGPSESEAATPPESEPESEPDRSGPALGGPDSSMVAHDAELNDFFDDDEEEAAPPSDGTTPNWRRPLVIGGVAIALVAIAGMGTASLVDRGNHSESTAAQPVETATTEAAPEAVNLPEGGTIAGLTDRVAVAVEGDQIRLLDPATGDQIGDQVQTDDPEGVRVVPTEDIDVIDTGDGAFLTYDGEGDPQSFDGQISVRGTVPVAIEDSHYRTVQNPEEQQNVPDGAAVFGATESGVALAKAPRTVTINGDDVELKPPHRGAEPSSWVQVSDEHIVILWPGDEDDDSEILAVHSGEDGEITDQTKVASDEVVVRNGTTQIGEDRYLSGGAIEEVCDGGKFISGTPVCPTENNTWESEHGSAASEPIALSRAHYVTTDHRVEALR